MKVSNQIKQLLHEEEVSITELASMLKTSQQNISNKLNRDSLKIEDIKSILEALGYFDFEIVARNNKRAIAFQENKELLSKDTKVYLKFESDDRSLTDIIEEEGLRRITFEEVLCEVVMEELRPTFQSVFGDIRNTYVPDDFKNTFKVMMADQLKKSNIVNINLKKG